MGTFRPPGKEDGVIRAGYQTVAVFDDANQRRTVPTA
jgi:hypothetical protein